MPTSVVIAAVGATISGSAIAAGVITWGFSMSAFVGSLVMSGLSAALRPDAPSQSAAADITNSVRTVTVRQPITPWRLIYGRTRTGGALTYKKVTGGKTYYHLIITLAGHVCEEIETIYFNDEEIPLDVDGNATGRFAGYVRIKKSLGGEAGQPFPDLVTESDGEWTDAHRQTGCAKIYVRLTASADLFPAGMPNITAIVKGKNDIYDPRDASVGWSDNTALIVANYLADPVRGLGCVFADEIDATDLIAAANVCDEAVTLAAGGSESRYTCNGSATASEKPVDLIPKLASAMAGYVVKIGATWRIIAGAYDTPSITLDEGDLAGAIQWQSLVSRRENCNAVKGVYVEPGNLWQPVDFPAIVSATYLAEDNNETVYHDLRLDYTDSASMAQRIAKIDLLRTRQGLTVSWPGKLSCFRAQPGSTVLLTMSKYGWTAKPFFVSEGRFSVNADGTLGYHLSLRETAAAVYDWATSEEQAIDLAPNTDLDNPLEIDAPGSPDVSESLYETTGSAGVKARASMSWAAVPDAFVMDYLPEYRVAAGTWAKLPPTLGVAVSIDDIAPGSYEFRVRARNRLGIASAYSATRSKTILGLSAAPADVSGFSVIKSAGFALAQWAAHGDLDVKIGGRIIIRHAPATTGATWSDGVILEEFHGNQVQGLVPLMTGTYFAKAIDSSGNYSGTAAEFVATEGMVTGFTTVATSTQDPGFSGSKTNLTVVSNTLRLDTLGTDATGSYLFAAALDMSTVATRRFEADIAASSFIATDLISARGLVSTWPSVAGAEVNDCDVTLYAATTDDDPAGAPTWSDWMPFFVADFTCRAAKFKLDFEAADATHNIAVDTLVIDVKEPV